MKQAAGTLFSDKDIGKIMDRKEYRERPHWARPILEKMVFEKFIWKSDACYLYPTEEQQKEQLQKNAKDACAAAYGGASAPSS